MMTKFGLILVLLLAKTLAEEHLEPIFRAAGGELEMGFCFGVDYIILYKLTENGKQLLGNSSNTTFAPPEVYRDRISHSNPLNELLGVAVVDLRLSDSGTYLRECWRDNELVNHHKNYLYVCDEEVSSQEIVLRSDGGTDLVCNVSISRRENASIRWFKEEKAGYKTSLFLDTKRSQEPLLEELTGVLQVQDKGSSLHLSEDGIKNNHHFICLVMEGQQCKAFQDIYLPDSSEHEIQPLYHGVGERAVLSCSSEHLMDRKVYWETPFGKVHETTPRRNKDSAASEMYISKNEEPGSYSLVIPSITLNHSGEYTCSTVEYLIMVCSELKTDMIQINTGNKVTMDCMTADESASIQWYRKTDPEESILIYDSGDPSLPIATSMHVSDTSLTITELSMEDSGIYWCVVLLNITDYYSDDTALFSRGEDEKDDETDDDYDWMTDEENTDRCILKQVTHLKVLPKNRTPTDSAPEPKSVSEAEFGSLQYAVIGGVLGLVVVMLIVVIVVKLRAKRREARESRVEPSAQQKESSVSDPLIALKRVS